MWAAAAMWVSERGGKEGASGRGRAPLIGFGSVFSLIHKQRRHHRGYLSSSVTAYSTLSPLSLALSAYCRIRIPCIIHCLLACSFAPCKLAKSYFHWVANTLSLSAFLEGWMDDMGAATRYDT